MLGTCKRERGAGQVEKRSGHSYGINEIVRGCMFQIVAKLHNSPGGKLEIAGRNQRSERFERGVESREDKIDRFIRVEVQRVLAGAGE